MIELTTTPNNEKPSIELPIGYNGKIQIQMSKEWLMQQPGFTKYKSKDKSFNLATNTLCFNRYNTKDFSYSCTYYNWVQQTKGDEIDTCLDIYNLTDKLSKKLKDLGINNLPEFNDIPKFTKPSNVVCTKINEFERVEDVVIDGIEDKVTYKFFNMPYEEYSILEPDDTEIHYDCFIKKLSYDKTCVQDYINFIAENGFTHHFFFEKLHGQINWIKEEHIFMFNVAKFLGLESIPVCTCSYEKYNTMGPDKTITIINILNHPLYNKRGNND